MKKGILLALTVFTTTLSFAQQNNNDEHAVRSLFTTLETGWNNKSGATYSSAFADVHDYIVVNGMYLSNFTKKGNEAAHQVLFDGIHNKNNLKLKVDKINFPRPDLATVTAIGASYPAGGAVPEHPGIIMTVIAEKKKGAWKIISFHNHELKTDEIKQRSPIPMEVMYGSWYKK